MIIGKVKLGDIQYSLNDIIEKIRYVRGFNYCTTYCIIDLYHASSAILVPQMTGSKISIQYGGDEHEQSAESWIDMVIFQVQNLVEFGQAKVRITAVEEGFLALSNSPEIKAYQDKKISDIISEIANDAGLSSNVEATRGQSTFLQTNINDLQFILGFLLDLSITSDGKVPYFFTVDQGSLIFKTPNVTQSQLDTKSVLTNIETNVKRVLIKNDKSILEFGGGGGKYKGYGFDPVSDGSLVYEASGDLVSLLSNMTNSAESTQVGVFPHDQKWMIEAITKNKLARNQLNVSLVATLTGSTDYEPDQVIEFVIPRNMDIADGQEYSGKYWVSDVMHEVKRSFFVSYLNLVSNSTKEGAIV